MPKFLLILIFGCLFKESEGQNIAINKETKQTSAFFWASEVVIKSQLAVDGIIEQDRGSTCAHTKCNETNQWWAVDLGKPYYIDRVIIYGRRDCCEHRLRDFEILLYDPSIALWDTYDNQAAELCYKQNGISPTVLNVSCVTDAIGRYLKISKNTTRTSVHGTDDCFGALSLCEVQVFGRNISTNVKTDDTQDRGQVRAEGNTTMQSEHRLRDFEILLYNPSIALWDTYDNQTDQLCYKQNGISPTVLNVSCVTDAIGRYLKISKNTTRTSVHGKDNCINALTLCEVQVFGHNISTNIKIDDDTQDRGQVRAEGNTTMQSDLMCPCACSYKHKFEYWANMNIPHHTMEEWRIILAPKLEQLERELRINKTELSINRRQKISTADNRTSAQRLGIAGIVFLSIAFALVVYIDVAAVSNGVKVKRRMRSRAKTQHHPNA